MKLILSLASYIKVKLLKKTILVPTVPPFKKDIIKFPSNLGKLRAEHFIFHCPIPVSRNQFKEISQSYSSSILHKYKTWGARSLPLKVTTD